MSIRQSLLAILDQGSCYGYQLRGEFDRRTGSAWPLNVGQVYNTLDRLERDGHVKKADTDKDGHVYYAITDSGRAEVSEWLGSPVARSGAVRDELAIKLAIAVTLPNADVGAVVRAQRAASLRSLHDLTTAKNATGAAVSTDDLAAVFVIDSIIFATEAELRWLDHVETQLATASAAGIRAPQHLSAETPKRGRPARVAPTGS